MEELQKTREDLEREIKTLREELAALKAGFAPPTVKDGPADPSRQLMELIPGVAYQIDPQGIFTFVSDSVREMGYDPCDLVGRHFSVLIHPEDLASVCREYVLPRYQGKITGRELSPKLFDERRTDDRQTEGLEVRILGREAGCGEESPKSPELVMGEVTSSGLYTKSVQEKDKEFLGSTGVLKVLEDTGESISRFLDGLADTEYKTIVNVIPDIVYKVDSDGNFVYLNDAVKRLGYEPEELIGKHFTTFLTPEVAQKVSRVKILKNMKGKKTGELDTPKLFDERRTGSRKTSRLELPILKKSTKKQSSGKNGSDRKTLLAEVTASGYFETDEYTGERKFKGTVGIIRDITERKTAENKLLLLSSAIEQSSEVVVITDLMGKIQYTNPAFERITGYRMQEVVGENPRVLKSGKHEEQFYHALWETILSGGIWKGYMINRRKDGVLYEEEAVVFPVKDHDGRIVNFTKIARDVTEEREMESSLRQAQKMEALGRLAGGVAHDFNNLLTGLIGNAELARSALLEGDPIVRNVDEILRISDRASNLIRQLLVFSRKDITAPRVLDVNDILLEMEGLLSRLIGEHIEISTDLSPLVSCVKIDVTRLEQIIINLTINARDAMPRGGRLMLRTYMVDLGQDPSLGHKDAQNNRYVCIEVSDTGIGLDDKTMPHIFEPFFTTKEKGKGTGLGLSTVYGIVKQSNGFIKVESQLSVGTTFRIFLPPAESPDTVTQKGGHVNERLYRGTETILVVEDEETIRDFLKVTLEASGYNAHFASNAGDALLLCDSLTPDLALLDLVLPDINGRELSVKIEEKFKETKILFMSGYSQDIIENYFFDKEHFNFISKPFKTIEILEKIWKTLHS
jgi:PAS domain S-box-containing protein